MIRVGIIGLGYVGLTLGIALADRNVEVYGTEINPVIKECLKKNKAHFFEPGLDEMIEHFNNKMFFCVEKFPNNITFDAFVITVGTPLKKGEKFPNFDYIKEALSSIKEVYDGRQLIILRSTVSVGTTRNIVIPYLSQICGKTEDEILVSMCPERTVEGKAVEELMQLPQIISGNNVTALKIAKNIFGQLTKNIIATDSLEEAELIKLFCNTYRDMSFAIGNAFCMAAQKFGVDGQTAICRANERYARSNIALPGFVSGPCLEKDTYILTNNMPECFAKEFILAGRYINESLEDIVVEWVKKQENILKNKVLTLSGIAFKGYPETSDLRGSASVYVAKKLMDLGYQLRFHDFVASIEEMEALGLGIVYTSLKEACDGSSALLILNNHRKYKTIEKKDIVGENLFEFLILDVWNVCCELQSDNNIKLFRLGNLEL